MDRKTSIVLVLLLLLVFMIVTVNAGTQLTQMMPSLRFPVDMKDPPPFMGWLQEHDSIIVTHAPDNLQWSSIDPLGSDCRLPSGPILAGDRITACYGMVTLRWIHGNYLIGKWQFAERDQSYEPPETQQENPTSEEPELLPTITITKPTKNALYIRNTYIKKFSKTVLIGPVTIETKISNPDNLQLGGVKFYIDGELKCHDTSAPYTWKWNEKTVGKHTIKVEVCSETYETLASNQLTISTLNLKVG
jgi:hypothetical protein